MKKNIIGIFICMLVLSSVIVSAARIMNTSSTNANENVLNYSSTKNYSSDKSIIMNDEDNKLSQQGKTKTGFLSIPSGAFNPENNIMTYNFNGLSVRGNGTFYAPIYFPDKAIVTKLTFYWADDSESKNAELSLWRSGIEGGWAQMMAQLITYGYDGNTHNNSEDEIPLSTIDNSNYSYYLMLSSDLWVYYYNAQIEYTYKFEGSSVNCIEESYINEPNLLSNPFNK